MRDFAQQRQVFEQTRDPEAAKAEAEALSTIVNETDGSRHLYEEMKVMSELSALIYTVASLLDTIGKGGYEQQEVEEKSGWFSWWNKAPPKLQQLERLDLVLAEDCFGEDDGKLIVEESDGDKSTTDYRSKLKDNLPAKDILEFLKANEAVLSRDPEITGDTDADDKVSPEANVLLEAIETVKLHVEDNLVWTMDHHFGSTDLVYAVTVNRKLKRITVGFRGSVTGTDWYQNIQVNLRTLPTPDLLKEQLGFEEEIKVHLGFKKYLLDDDIEQMELSPEQMHETRPGKYGQILRDLEACYNYKDEKGNQPHKDFHLYVTGHSLGAALSTLLAMRLSCSWILRDIIPKPVVNISVASPYGWLRHIRITSQGDIVPVGPPKYFLYNKFRSVYNEPYCHTGCNVHLTGDVDEPAEIGFGVERTVKSQFSLSAVERHTVKDYWTRQRDGKATFEKLTVQGLYEEKKDKNDDETEGTKNEAASS
ncbi:MAG: hypothetical protein SGARI_000587 [Bacillariaceae sp.]